MKPLADRCVAIGLPVYNGDDFLEEAVRSLLAQTHTNVRLFISDNHSSDRTGEICRTIAAEDGRVVYFRQPATLNIALNFDFVLQKAEGDYFMWAGHDDIWDPRFIEKCLERLVRTDSAVSFCNFDLIAADRRKVTHFDLTPLEGKPGLRSIWSFIREPDVMGKANPMYGIFPLADLRRDYDSFLIKYVDIHGHDMSFVFQMLVKKGIAIVPETLFRKRIPDRQLAGPFKSDVSPYLLYRSLTPKAYLRHLLLYAKIGAKFGYPIISTAAVCSRIVEFFYFKIGAKFVGPTAGSGAKPRI